jgi:hypothetical protein
MFPYLIIIKIESTLHVGPNRENAACGQEESRAFPPLAECGEIFSLQPLVTFLLSAHPNPPRKSQTDSDEESTSESRLTRDKHKHHIRLSSLTSPDRAPGRHGPSESRARKSDPGRAGVRELQEEKAESAIACGLFLLKLYTDLISSATAPFPATTAASAWCSVSFSIRSPRRARRQSRALRRPNSAETPRNEALSKVRRYQQHQSDLRKPHPIQPTMTRISSLSTRESALISRPRHGPNTLAIRSP